MVVYALVMTNTSWTKRFVSANWARGLERPQRRSLGVLDVPSLPSTKPVLGAQPTSSGHDVDAAFR